MSETVYEAAKEDFVFRYLDTIQVKVEEASKIKTLAEANGVNFFYPTKNTVSISVNETTSQDDLNTIVKIFADSGF